MVTVQAEFRFPMPEFESGYEHPEMHTPMPAASRPWMDMALLFLALSLASWFAIKQRSRTGLFLLTIASVAYFGFWRKGCVCPVGSVQNVLSAFFFDDFAVPLVVIVFFLLPLIFALFFGRVFCSSVCPLGAVQELVAIKPIQLSRPVEAALSILPYLYLGLTVLAIGTGSGYIICRYDPFVGFFRFGASFDMFIVGAAFLIGGIFIGRPYCRFLCPYGVLLRWMSRFSKYHLSITPAECIQCRLCETACPYDAIEAPTPSERPMQRAEGTRKMGWLLALAPLMILLGAGTGYLSHEFIARMNPTVQLADRIAAEQQGIVTDMTEESEAFRSTDQTVDELYAEAQGVIDVFQVGVMILGAFLGLVAAVKLMLLFRVRKQEDYLPDQSACVSCGRCFAYCPVTKASVDEG